MKFTLVLLTLYGPMSFTFDQPQDCIELGEKQIKLLADYKDFGKEQGWYTQDGNLIYGFYCNTK